MIVTFTLPGVTLSQNVYDRLHWGKKHRLRDEWFWLVLEALGKGNANQRAGVTITRVGKRLIDEQNLSAAMKPILDALVHYKHLVGDGPKDLDFFITKQRKTEKGELPHMEILINYV